MSPVVHRAQRRHLTASAAALGLAALLVLTTAVPAGPVRAVAHCDVATSSWTATSEVDAALTAEFARYGDEKDGWSGGDSTYSVPMSGKRTVWLFSDTFVGPVNEDGTQPLDTGFVNSSFVVQHKGHLQRTVTGGTAEELTGLLAPDEDGWYWLGAGHLTDDGSSLDVVFLRFERFGDGPWDWGWAANVLGRFDPRSLKLREVVPLPSESGVNWGSWLRRDGDHTLIYGVEDLGSVKYMRVARVPGDDLTQPWEYWTGAAWSSLEAASVRIMPGVANEYSVEPFGDGYLLVTQDTTLPFSAEIVGYVSCSPTGPFVPIGTLYTTPETGEFGSYGNPNIFTYNAHEHPELRNGSELLITYNVNSFDWTELYDDVTIYRPRFVRVTLTEG
jgi:hypothetical protein